MTTETPEQPLSQKDLLSYRARAARGEKLPLAIIRAFVATTRKAFSSSPSKTEKAAKTRIAKEKPTANSDVDFF